MHSPTIKDSIEARMNDIGKKPEYVAKLAAMTDEQLFTEAEQYIWLSAYADNNPRSAYHWMCDATYDEAQRRGKTDIYSRAHKKASSR